MPCSATMLHGSPEPFEPTSQLLIRRSEKGTRHICGRRPAAMRGLEQLQAAGRCHHQCGTGVSATASVSDCFFGAESAALPLSAQLGGKPRPFSIAPGSPGDLPNVSHATCLGAAPKDAFTLSRDGGAGHVPNGLLPVTSNLLKSSPNSDARS